MTNTLTQDAAYWIRAMFGMLWQFFAHLTIPGTTISIGMALISMAAISVIIGAIRLMVGSMYGGRRDFEYEQLRSRHGGNNGRE